MRAFCFVPFPVCWSCHCVVVSGRALCSSKRICPSFHSSSQQAFNVLFSAAEAPLVSVKPSSSGIVPNVCHVTRSAILQARFSRRGGLRLATHAVCSIEPTSCCGLLPVILLQSPCLSVFVWFSFLLEVPLNPVRCLLNCLPHFGILVWSRQLC